MTRAPIMKRSLGEAAAESLSAAVMMGWMAKQRATRAVQRGLRRTWARARGGGGGGTPAELSTGYKRQKALQAAARTPHGPSVCRNMDMDSADGMTTSRL